jgi:CIC family chloride channel protein
VGCFSLNLLKTSVLQKDLLESIIIAQDLAVPDIEIDFSANLEQAMEIFGREDVAEISVLKDKKLIGVIKRKDVIEAYNHEISMREAASGLVQKLKFSHVTKTTDIGKGYQITEIDAPASFWDKSLKKLNLKAQHRIDILMIKRKSPLQTITLPSADEIIKKEDTLILIGHEDNIKKITRNKAS